MPKNKKELSVMCKLLGGHEYHSIAQDDIDVLEVNKTGYFVGDVRVEICKRCGKISINVVGHGLSNTAALSGTTTISGTYGTNPWNAWNSTPNTTYVTTL